MIKAYDGTKITPKQKAEELLMHQIAATLLRFNEQEYEHHGMTEREKALVADQIMKVGDRLAKKLGYEEAFWV